MDACEAGFFDLLKTIETEGVTQNVKMFLGVLLPQPLVTRSFKLLYQGSTIKCFIAKNSRRHFWTISSNKNKHVIFPDQSSWFCSCLSYSNDVVKKGQFPLCKHLLTVLVCNALLKKGDTSQFTVEELEDDSFSEVIGSSFHSSSFNFPKRNSSI